MSTNFTPLSKSTDSSKGASNTNMALIIIALGITVLLGVWMWFLVVQKQREEKNAQVKFDEQSKLRIAKQAEIDSKPLATPSASTSVTPTKAQVTVTPVASPSATITP